MHGRFERHVSAQGRYWLGAGQKDHVAPVNQPQRCSVFVSVGTDLTDLSTASVRRVDYRQAQRPRRFGKDIHFGEYHG